MFIAIEGVDNCGKSTLKEAIYSQLFDLGYNVHTFKIHKPGITEKNELTYIFQRYDNSPRISHILKNNHILLLDRFSMSNSAYILGKHIMYFNQSFGGNIKKTIFNPSVRQFCKDIFTAHFNLEHIYFKLPRPDLTILIDVPDISKLNKRESLTEVEKDTRYQECVMEAYRFIQSLNFYNTVLLEYTDKEIMLSKSLNLILPLV